jgi:hypothetical protein
LHISWASTSVLTSLILSCSHSFSYMAPFGISPQAHKASMYLFQNCTIIFNLQYTSPQTLKIQKNTLYISWTSTSVLTSCILSCSYLFSHLAVFGISPQAHKQVMGLFLKLPCHILHPVHKPTNCKIQKNTLHISWAGTSVLFSCMLSFRYLFSHVAVFGISPQAHKSVMGLF